MLLSRGLRLLLSGFEDAFFIAPDALMRVQAFENEFRGRDLLLRAFLLRHAERAELLDQALNFFQVVQRFRAAETESDNWISPPRSNHCTICCTLAPVKYWS